MLLLVTDRLEHSDLQMRVGICPKTVKLPSTIKLMATLHFAGTIDNTAKKVYG